MLRGDGERGMPLMKELVAGGGALRPTSLELESSGGGGGEWWRWLAGCRHRPGGR